MPNKYPPSSIKFIKRLDKDGQNNAGVFLYIDQKTRIQYVKKKAPAGSVERGAFAREVQIASQIKGHANVGAPQGLCIY